MAVAIHTMVNEDLNITEGTEKVLDVFKEGRESGKPWGRANPKFVMDQTGLEKSNAQYHLRRLDDAGWITKRSTGFYEFVVDPREADESDAEK